MKGVLWVSVAFDGHKQNHCAVMGASSFNFASDIKKAYHLLARKVIYLSLYLLIIWFLFVFGLNYL